MLILMCALALFTVVIPLLLGGQSYTVLTGSMTPSLKPGHLIAVRATPIDDIRIGNIVTYQIESGKPEVVTHRVVSVGYDSTGERVLYTQGDANNAQDDLPVHEVQVRGVVVYAVPWLGYINIWGTPAVKSIVVTAVGVGAIAWGIVVFAKDARRRRRTRSITNAAAALVMIGAAVAFAPATNAVAAESDDPTADYLQISTDGVTWHSADDITLPDDLLDRIVPGEALPLDLWVRNSSADTSEVSITGLWSPARAGDPGDEALASDLIPPRLDPRELEPGEELRAPVSVGLPESSGNITRLASAELTITVTLTETIPGDGNDEPLAITGAPIPVGVIILASLLLGAGLILFIIRIIAARRNRRDP